MSFAPKVPFFFPTLSSQRDFKCKATFMPTYEYNKVSICLLYNYNNRIINF